MLKNSSEVTLVPKKNFLKIFNLVQSFVGCKVSLADGSLFSCTGTTLRGVIAIMLFVPSRSKYQRRATLAISTTLFNYCKVNINNSYANQHGNWSRGAIFFKDTYREIVILIPCQRSSRSFINFYEITCDVSCVRQSRAYN